MIHFAVIFTSASSIRSQNCSQTGLWGLPCTRWLQHDHDRSPMCVGFDIDRVVTTEHYIYYPPRASPGSMNVATMKWLLFVMSPFSEKKKLLLDSFVINWPIDKVMNWPRPNAGCQPKDFVCRSSWGGHGASIRAPQWACRVPLRCSFFEPPHWSGCCALEHHCKSSSYYVIQESHMTVANSKWWPTYYWYLSLFVFGQWLIDKWWWPIPFGHCQLSFFRFGGDQH